MFQEGKFDDNLKALANDLKQYKVKYLLRIGYEVSGNLFANTNPSSFDPSTWDLDAYPKAFKHVKDLFSAIIPDMEYVYHPTRGTAEQLSPNRLFPGIVDWQGMQPALEKSTDKRSPLQASPPSTTTSA